MSALSAISVPQFLQIIRSILYGRAELRAVLAILIGMIPLRDVIPSRTFPGVTVAIIAVNSLAFLYEASLPDRQLNAFVNTWALVPAYFSWVTVVHLDVPARRLAARDREHVVSLDLRRQRRRPRGSRALSRLLSAVRNRRGARAGVQRSDVDGADVGPRVRSPA